MNPRQEAFFREYLKDFSCAGAARRVGYSQRNGTKLLKHPEIQEKIRLYLEQQGPADGGAVVRELERLAFAEGSDESGAKVKLASKLRALELLGKHFGIFESQTPKGLPPVTIVEDIG